MPAEDRAYLKSAYARHAELRRNGDAQQRDDGFEAWLLKRRIYRFRET